MKLHEQSRMIHRAVGAICLLVSAISAHSAPPTIQWNAALYGNGFPTPNGGGWYQAVQAQAHDDDGNLTGVRVDYLNPSTNSWTPFAWNGGGNGTDNSSDPNFIQAIPASPGYAAQAFRAQASDASGNNTQFIYLLVKPGGQYFTVDDLPVEPANGHRFVPNAYNYQINSRILGGVLNHLNGKSNYTIWFKDGVYDFDSSWERRPVAWRQPGYPQTPDENHPFDNVTGSEDEAAKVDVSNGTYMYNPGTLGRIAGATNITFKAENLRAAVLNWTSYSRQGTFVPSGTGEMFIGQNPLTGDQSPLGQLDGNNVPRYQKYLATTSDRRPWPLPGPFIVIESNCFNVVFDGLEFQTRYALKTPDSRADNGHHLAISGTYTQIKNCGFSLSPGWSILVSGAQDVHLDANILHSGSGDGINLQNANGTWIVGNVVSNVGDDAIVLTGDNNHAIWNYIEKGGWRGFYVDRSTNSEIAYNTIVSCGGSGIEASPLDDAGTTGTTTNLSIHDNQFSGIGGWPHHHGGSYIGPRDVMVLDRTSGIQVSTLAQNTLTYFAGGGGAGANGAGIRIRPASSYLDSSKPTIRLQNSFPGFPSGAEVP